MTQIKGFVKISDDLIHPDGGIPCYELQQSNATGRYYLFNVFTGAHEQVDQSKARRLRSTIEFERARAKFRKIRRELRTEHIATSF